MSPSSSPKRSRGVSDASDRPAKLAKVSPEPEPTGLEQSDILKSVSPKNAASNQNHVEKQKRRLMGRVSSNWKNMPTSSQQGMRNLTGALCYRHSLFQALVHSPKVANWLRKYHAPDTCIVETPDSCVACKLLCVIEAYWSGKSTELTKSLANIDKVFKTNKWTPGSASGQADPEEQFTWLINKMSEQLPKQIYGFFEAFHNFAIDSSTSCTKCGHVSTISGETEGVLSVEIQPKIHNGNLSQYLNKYLSYSVHGYKCDGCQDTSSTKQRTRLISHSPDVAIIQLKRFDPLGRKVNSVVPIPTTLNLNEKRTTANKKNSVYQLSAVIKHAGTSGSGHYTCCAVGPDGNWHLFDDDRKSTTTSEVAAAAKGRMTPYILFFQRQRKKKMAAQE